MTIHNAKLQLVVTADKDDLNIKTGIDCHNLPHQLKEIMSDLLVKFPVLIRSAWFYITDNYADAENGFDVTLTFHFEKEQGDDWSTSAKSTHPGTVEDLLLGMAKMIFQEDPIIDELIEMELEELDLPEYVQHFDPTC